MYKGPVTHKNLPRIYEEFCILPEFFTNFTCISSKNFLEKFGILPLVSNSSSVFIKSNRFDLKTDTEEF